MRRHLVLPNAGPLLVSTDVHGNLEDFERLCAVFVSLGAEARWAILGDVVHAPDARARLHDPDLYDYDDGSSAIVDRILRLEREAPSRVHFVLGNHDHGHVGGPHPAKFHADEVDALETSIGSSAVARMRELFSRALLVIAAPCGALLCHGSPDASFRRLDDVDVDSLDPAHMSEHQRAVLRALLTAYGQTDGVAREMLEGLSRTSGLELRFVVHGHDRDPDGFFYEGETQLCPVLFGARRESKRYVVLDLGARYPSARAVRDGVEIRRLYP